MKTTRTEKFTLIPESRNYSMNGIRNIWTNTEKSLLWGVLKILKGVYILDILDTKRGKSRWHRVTERVCLSMLSHFSRVWLCNPMDYSPPCSSVHGILQARILEWVAMPSSRGSSWPGGQTCISMSPQLEGGFFITSATWKAQQMGYGLLNALRLAENMGNTFDSYRLGLRSSSQ